MNIDKMVDLLRRQEKLKMLAAQELAGFLSLSVNDIFYSYIKNTIPSKGITNTGVKFFFHGLKYYVKKNDWDVELEFGPN